MVDTLETARQLRACSELVVVQVHHYDEMLRTVANALDPPRNTKPLFYVKGDTVFQRPVKTEKGVAMGFSVCTVCDGVDPDELCAILNKGEPAKD